MLDGLLSHQKKAEHIEVELLVKVLRGDHFQRQELVEARVVDEDVELAERFLCFGKKTLNILGLGNIGLDGDSLPLLLGDALDDGIRSGLAAGVVDDDGCALGRQVLGNRGADSLGSPGDNGDFSLQPVHRSLLCLS